MSSVTVPPWSMEQSRAVRVRGGDGFMDPISQGAECQLGAGPILLCSGKTHNESSSLGCDKGSS